MTRYDAICVRIDDTARVIRESRIGGSALELATQLLPQALEAARDDRLDEAKAILAKLEEVPL